MAQGFALNCLEKLGNVGGAGLATNWTIENRRTIFSFAAVAAIVFCTFRARIYLESCASSKNSHIALFIP